MAVYDFTIKEYPKGNDAQYGETIAVAEERCILAMEEDSGNDALLKMDHGERIVDVLLQNQFSVIKTAFSSHINVTATKIDNFDLDAGTDMLLNPANIAEVRAEGSGSKIWVTAEQYKAVIVVDEAPASLIPY